MGTLIVNQYANGLDSDAATYIASVEAADGQTLEGATKTAINDFVVGCKTDGVWDAIKASCIMAGARTLAGALTPLVGAAPTNFNFVAGDYDRKTGLKGDGGKTLDSNRANNADPQNDKHLSAYVTEENYSGFLLASGFSASQGESQIAFSATIYFRINYPGGFGAVSTTTNGSTGLVYGGRQNETTGLGYYDNRLIEVAEQSYPPTSSNIFVFSRSRSLFNLSRISFYSIGTYLNPELLNLRLTQLMTDINNAF